MRDVLLILIIAAVLFTGCVGETTTDLDTSAPMEYANPNAIADAAWVTDNLGDANVKIIATPATKDSYEEGHIPGAVYVDYKTDIVDLNAPIDNQMAPKEKVQDLLRGFGIKNSDTILVYDNTNNMISGRMLNVLKFYGHEDVRLLNGGKNTWTTYGGELSPHVPTVTASDYTAKDKNSREYVDLEYVYNNLDNPGVLIVDVRPTDQYTGENVRPSIGRGGGHLPGAINVPGGLTWNDDKTIKSYDELKEIYENAGVTKDKKIIVHCHSGMLSSYSWYVLSQLLGYPDVALYDGSALEFTNHPDIPLVTGPEPGEVPEDLKPLF
jgi:thiosulfate/3-mercaptopyruvate sulfurtransferase